MKRLFFLFLTITFTLAIQAQRPFSTDSLKEGDLLFVCHPQGNAITKVTQGIHGAAIDHVGIAVRRGVKWEVLEAIHQGVVLTPLEKFIRKNTAPSAPYSSILRGRVTGDVDISTSIRKAMSYLGRPYDFYFMPDDKEIYCSELVQKSYVDHSGHLIFPPVPMSFHNRRGQILPYWKNYYRKKGMPVPEGKPGSNPGELSRNGRVRIE
ncbi:MAG: hypothetical protein LKK50_00995 [Prevotella sp.]|jgi:cell wall-associated NlpC family hydrolase|nr:hypothetical protein [Prevotella sp.]MCI1684717.1 hypothetical protein [Prevotella sp.]MCI1780374.1 hypothetical protein [Prevotella sp.]MCI1801761.1 hypothetical protein [Prevotella sp.]MCI1816809.1 hypothetical protein [Prevotella sp.]